MGGCFNTSENSGYFGTVPRKPSVHAAQQVAKMLVHAPKIVPSWANSAYYVHQVYSVGVVKCIILVESVSR